MRKLPDIDNGVHRDILFSGGDAEYNDLIVNNNLSLTNVTQTTNTVYNTLVLDSGVVKTRPIYDDPVVEYHLFDDFNSYRPENSINGQESYVHSKELWNMRGILGSNGTVVNDDVPNDNALFITNTSATFPVYYSLYSKARLNPSNGNIIFQTRLKLIENHNHFLVFYGLGSYDSSTPFTGLNIDTMNHQIGFYYNSGTHGENIYRMRARDGTTSSEVSTNSPISYGTYQVLKIVYDISLTKARFYVNNILVGTKLNNLPSLTSRLCPYISVHNDANVPERTISIDYISLKQVNNRHIA